MQRRVLTFCIVLAFATAAVTARADDGWFAVASVADSSVELGGPSGVPIDDEETSFELAVGRAFGPYFAIQAGYHEYGTVHGGTCPPEMLCLMALLPDRAELDGWSLRLAGTWPFTDRLAAFASAGMLAWNADLRSEIVTAEGVAALETHASDEDLIYAAGVRWRLGERWHLEVAYERSELDLDSSKLGLLYRF